MDTLKLIRDGITRIMPMTGDAVLTSDEQAALHLIAKNNKEAGVVAFLTPFLKRLCLPPVSDEWCPLVMLNSEKLPWLINPAVASHPNLRTKPDLFTSWAPFVKYRVDDVAGVLGDYALQKAGCVRQLFEAKREPLTDSFFGELHSYMTYIPGCSRGMLFNSSDFWLYEASGGHPVRLIKGAWTDGGSANAIQTFFQTSLPDDSPLVSLTRVLFERMRVRPHHDEKGRCFLGSGATGYVFRVRDSCGNVRALKVVPNASHALVINEFLRLQLSAQLGAPVVPVVDDSLHLLPASSGVPGAGFLLQDIGEPFQLASLQHCVEAFEALASLHRLRIAHGDPRLPNLVRVIGHARWIDMRDACQLEQKAPLAVQAGTDVLVLARSVLGLDGDANAGLPQAIVEECSLYVAANMSRDSTDALAAAVWAVRRSAR